MTSPRPVRAIAPAIAILVSILSGAPSMAADEPASTSPTLASDPIFSALLIDGSTASGRIRDLGPDGELVLVDGDEPRTIAIDRLVKLEQVGTPPPWPPEGSLAVFPDGDRLRVIIDTSVEDKLQTRSFLLDDLSIPLDASLGLLLVPPIEAGPYEDLLEKVREQPREAEVLWLANRDRLQGGFLGLGARQVAFQIGPTRAEIDRGQVVALGFDPRLVRYPKPEGDFLDLSLVDGSRLGVSEARIAAGRLEATTRFGVPIKLALIDLAGLHARTRSVAYLSDRAADASNYETYVGPSRPYRRDRNVEGRALRLGGRAYDRGLGTQSRTLLAYQLREGDARFQATIGLDDAAGPLGSVVFRVIVDREERLATPALTARDAPRAIDVDVSGGRILILVTEFGDRGEVRDLADWVEARLIRRPDPL